MACTQLDCGSAFSADAHARWLRAGPLCAQRWAIFPRFSKLLIVPHPTSFPTHSGPFRLRITAKQRPLSAGPGPSRRGPARPGRHGAAHLRTPPERTAAYRRRNLSTRRTPPPISAASRSSAALTSSASAAHSARITPPERWSGSTQERPSSTIFGRRGRSRPAPRSRRKAPCASAGRCPPPRGPGLGSGQGRFGCAPAQAESERIP